MRQQVYDARVMVALRRSLFVPSIAAVAAILGAGGSALQAAEIVADGTTCTLAAAIVAANTDSAAGGCTAGSGDDLIQLDADVTLTAGVTPSVEGGPSGLPSVSSVITIQARAGELIERSSGFACGSPDPTFRLLHVAGGGDLTLNGLTLRNGCVWGAGGAILVQAGASLRLADGVLDANAAIGVARGGAVAVLAGQLEVVRSTFSENWEIATNARGGAVYVEDGTVSSIADSVFVANHAGPPTEPSLTSYPAAGGGLSLVRTNTGSIARTIFAGNIAGRTLLQDPPSSTGGPAAGGGLHVEGGWIGELRDSLFADNVARAGNAFIGLSGGDTAVGGGLSNTGRIDTITRTAFVGNQAIGMKNGDGRGGGIANQGQIGTIEASTFAANIARAGSWVSTWAVGRGGGIDNRRRIERLVASTLVGNLSIAGNGHPTALGGGISFERTTIDSVFRIESSVLADNVGDVGSDCFATDAIATAGVNPIVSLGFNFVESSDASCTFSAPGDIVGPDPQVLPLADNGCATTLPDGSCLPTVALPETSPAIDQGRCSTTGSRTDARGALRPHDVAAVVDAAGGDGCDVGAFERDAAFPEVHVTSHAADSIDPVVSGSGPGNLVYTLFLASSGSLSADNVAVDVDLTLPSGVTLDTVTPSSGSWDGSTWTLASLAVAEGATLTLELTVAAATVGGTDVIAVTAAVTAADGHDGPFTSDTEATSVLQPILLDGFESGDATGWSACAPAGPPC